jgi:hypothetical protein
MPRLLLVSKSSSIEVSHFYNLVSSYELSDEMLGQLREDILEAVKEAKNTGTTQIVDLDRVDFCFHVYPSGSISLMAEIRHFDNIIVPDPLTNPYQDFLDSTISLDLDLHQETVEKLSRYSNDTGEDVASIIRKLVENWNPLIDETKKRK